MMAHPALSELPLYWQDRWLDLVAGACNWKRIDLVEDSRLIGSWVYISKKRMGLSIVSMPNLTAYSGPWINPRYLPEEPYKRNVFLKEKLDKLALDLPKTDVFFQQLMPGFEGEFALQWLGFKQAFRYTFFVPKSTHLRQLEADAGWKARSHVKNARSLTKIRVAINFEAFKEYFRFHFPNREVNPVVRVLSALIEDKSASIIELIDAAGKCQGISVLVWDQQCTYLLFALRNPSANVPNSMQVLIWESIKMSLHVGRDFDFEGSVHRNIFASFSRYGAEMRKHTIIWKTSSSMLNFAARVFNKGIYQL